MNFYNREKQFSCLDEMNLNQAYYACRLGNFLPHERNSVILFINFRE